MFVSNNMANLFQSLFQTELLLPCPYLSLTLPFLLLIDQHWCDIFKSDSKSPVEVILGPVLHLSHYCCSHGPELSAAGGVARSNEISYLLHKMLLWQAHVSLGYSSTWMDAGVMNIVELEYTREETSGVINELRVKCYDWAKPTALHLSVWNTVLE